MTDEGQSWDDFARNNDAPKLAALLGDRTLWSYFYGDEPQELRQLLVERVRPHRRWFRYSCAATPPHARRSFDTTIMPEPNSRVDFWCALTFEESRPPVAILDPQSDRDDRAQPVAVCSWCGRGHHGSAWLDIEELVHTAQLLERASMPAISYGICAGCRDEMAAAVLVLGGADESFAWPESYNSEDPTSTPASSERLFTSTCP